MKAIFYTAILGLVLASPVSAGGFIASPQNYPNAAAYAAAYAKSAQDVGGIRMTTACYSEPSAGSYNYGKCRDVLTPMDRKVLDDRGNTGGRSPAALTGG